MKQISLIVLLVLVVFSLCAPDNCSVPSFKPDSLQAETGDQFIILTWELDSPTVCVDRYEIAVFLSDEGTEQLLNNLDLNTSDARGVVVGDLENGLNYRFQIIAFNQFGSNQASTFAVPGELDDGEFLPPNENPNLQEDDPPANVVPSPTAPPSDPPTNVVPSPTAPPSDPPANVVPPSAPVDPTGSAGSVSTPMMSTTQGYVHGDSNPIMNTDPTGSADFVSTNITSTQAQASPPPISQPTVAAPVTTLRDSVPDQPNFVSARCAIKKCCVKWRDSIIGVVPADYFVIGMEYRDSVGMLISRGTELIDYSVGLKFAQGFNAERETCVVFDGLEEEQLFRFQVVGINDNGFSEASRWSVAGRTRSPMRIISSIANDCGCDKMSIQPPTSFDLNAFQVAFPGQAAP